MDNSSDNNSKILARLAQDDINIFNVHQEGEAWVVEYEYGWQPTDYKTKWTKAVYMMDSPRSLGELLSHVLQEVRSIREELGN
jgi:hypothetical protein